MPRRGVVPSSTQHNICSGDEPGASNSQQLCNMHPRQGLCRDPGLPARGVTALDLTLPGPNPEPRELLLPRWLHFLQVESA